MIYKNIIERIPERLKEYRKVVPDGELECVWAEAGVVPYKLCDSEFDCSNCIFDMVMRGGNELVPRRIYTKGGKLCPHRFYHHCHTWAKVEGNALVRVGIDDFGQNILGPIEEISLPIRDEKLGKKSIRVKGRGIIIPIISPVDGYVVAVNEDLVEQPQLANKSPYDKGWLVMIRPTRLVKNLKNLFYGPDALQWFDVEIFRFAALVSAETNSYASKELGMTLPDGGLPDFEILNDLHQSIKKRVLEQCFLYAHTHDTFKT